MKKSGLLNLAIFLILLSSCPSLAEEKTIEPSYPVKPPASESSPIQCYGPDGYGSEAEGHVRSALDANNYPYGPLGYGTESEGH